MATALATLIDDVRARNDWSDYDVARQATEAGHKLTKSDLSDYRRQGMRHIVPAKITALSHGLKIPAYRIAMAVLDDAGITLPIDARTPLEAIEHDHQLSASARKFLTAIITTDQDQNV